MAQIRFDYARFADRGGTHFTGWTMLGQGPAEPDDYNQKRTRE
jgi:hypothetical protein